MSAKIGDFLKKHGRILTYVGTSIVFLTFLVKGGFGESWSKRAEALDMAQYMYGLSTFSSEADVKLTRTLLADRYPPPRFWWSGSRD